MQPDSGTPTSLKREDPLQRPATPVRPAINDKNGMVFVLLNYDRLILRELSGTIPPLRSGVEVARRAHIPKVAGSNPVSAIIDL